MYKNATAQTQGPILIKFGVWAYFKTFLGIAVIKNYKIMIFLKSTKSHFASRKNMVRKQRFDRHLVKIASS